MSAFEKCVKSCESRVVGVQLGVLEAKSMLAGMYIAIGCMMMLMVRSDTTLSPAISSILSGICFSIGLFAVMTCSGELFTGDCLMILGVLERKYHMRDMIFTLLVVLWFNFVGALVVGALFNACGMQNSLRDGILAVKNAKMQLSWQELLARSVLCNFFVCMSVWIGLQTDEICGKFVAALVPVAAFVALGLEHSIANVFLYYVTEMDQIWCLESLVTCILGNVMGGMGAFATLQWLTETMPLVKDPE